MRLLILFVCLFAYAAGMPVEHEEAMNAALWEVFHVTEPESVERLLKGMSSPGLYKISVDGKAYVVRFSNTNRSMEDKERELHAMQIAAGYGLAPRIIYASIERGIIIMDYIESARHSLSEDRLRLLGAGLRKIHDGPAFSQTASIFEIASYFESLMGEEKPSLVRKASLVLDELQRELKDLLIEKPCHNDLNPNNILYSDGKIYFIDWECAGQGDPYFDLASPIVLFGMNQDQENTVLHAYFGRKPLAEEFYKFQKMKSFTGIYYGFALVGISHSQGEEFISEAEIDSLPALQEMHGDGDKIFPMGIQRFGLALLREALR